MFSAEKTGRPSFSPMNFELLYGCRAVDVGCNKQGFAFGFCKMARKFARGGCFTAALQAQQHNSGNRARAEMQPCVNRPHEVDQFLMADIDEVIAGCRP